MWITTHCITLVTTSLTKATLLISGLNHPRACHVKVGVVSLELGVVSLELGVVSLELGVVSLEF